MNPDLATALIGFGGALGGSAVGFGGVLLESRRAERRAERDLLRGIYGEFMSAIDQYEDMRGLSAGRDARLKRLVKDEAPLESVSDARDQVQASALETIAILNRLLALYSQLVITAPLETWQVGSRLLSHARNGDSKATVAVRVEFIVRAQIDLAFTRKRRKWAKQHTVALAETISSA